MNIEQQRKDFLKIQDKKFIELIEYSEKYGFFVFKSVNCDLERGVRLNTLNYGWKMWLAAQQQEGYVMVPVEPTWEMVEAAEGNNGHIESIYRDMIQAAQE